ncbi:MAG: antibiotic biosynthesis monooxygenase [Thermomicrobiales bacterium]|nr:antibiotic biosynthesis monooxygenase [Thermomicrobiales bacterium]
MYGLIGKIRAHPGQRDTLMSLMLQGSSAMPGCLSYIVARDAADQDLIWVTEVWDTAASHQASLGLPEVQATIAQARPLIAGFETGAETEPVGGVGLTASDTGH